MQISKVFKATTTKGLFLSCYSYSLAFSERRIPFTALSSAFHTCSGIHFAKNNSPPPSQVRNSILQNNCGGEKHSLNLFRKKTALQMSSTSNNDTNGRVALLQFKVTDSKSQNHETASTFLSKAAAQNAKMAILPEIWNSPYATLAFPEYAETLPSIGEDDVSNVSSPSAKLLMEKAKEYQMYIIGGSIPERVVMDSNEDDKELIYNTCLCINPQGKIVGKHRKVHLFDIDVPGKITFKESDTLSPGTGLTAFDTEPFGMVGVGICYDIRFPELAQCLIERGCRILVFPGAFNLTTGPAHWELLQRARAVDGQCYVLTASPARSDPPTNPDDLKYPHYSAWGHSTAVSPWGEVIATCNEDEHVVIVDLDMDKVDEMRESIPTFSQKRTDLYSLSDLDKQ